MRKCTNQYNIQKFKNITSYVGLANLLKIWNEKKMLVTLWLGSLRRWTF